MSGQLGDGTTAGHRAPLTALNTNNASAVAVGSNHACTVLSSGSVRCWGSNDSGKLGDGTTTARTNPTTVSDAAAYSAVSVGTSHTCGITAGATPVVKCWGLGSNGRLGNGATTTRTTPTQVTGLVGTALRIDVGDGHSCAVMQSGGPVSCVRLSRAACGRRRARIPDCRDSPFTRRTAGR